MKFQAAINVMPLDELLDPQGKVVNAGLAKMGFQGVSEVRIGKRIHIELEAADKATAENLVNEAAKKLLTNPVIEQYEFELTEV